MKNIKFKIPKIVLGFPIALISLRIYLAAILGYFFARFLATRLDSLIFNIGSYTVHFHHWLMGVGGIVLILIYNLSPYLENIMLGFLGGLIFEGVFSYPDWHRILIRKDKN